MLALLVFGGIQACDMIYLKHSLTAAAYEGSLNLNKLDATNADVEASVQQVLDARGVTNTTISILPAGTDIELTAAGTPLTIVVTADVNANLKLAGFFVAPTTIAGQVAATR